MRISNCVLLHFILFGRLFYCIEKRGFIDKTSIVIFTLHIIAAVLTLNHSSCCFTEWGSIHAIHVNAIENGGHKTHWLNVFKPVFIIQMMGIVMDRNCKQFFFLLNNMQLEFSVPLEEKKKNKTAENIRWSRRYANQYRIHKPYRQRQVLFGVSNVPLRRGARQPHDTPKTQWKLLLRRLINLWHMLMTRSRSSTCRAHTLNNE